MCIELIGVGTIGQSDRADIGYSQPAAAPPSVWESDEGRETALVFASGAELGGFKGRKSKSAGP